MTNPSWLSSARRPPLSRWFGVPLGALAIGALLGALFLRLYPSVPLSARLGLLFGLIGLIVAWLIRAGWLAVAGKRQ